MLNEQKNIGTNISRAAQLLRAGELVAIPTETVYGLGGNATDATAIAKIFQVKNRPSFDPLIIHLSNLEVVSKYVEEIPLALEKLAQAHWPGPLTLLLKRKPIIPDLVTSGLRRVAVRIPQHPLTRKLLAQLDFPLAAPSANPFGYISPTRASHVAAQLGEKIPYILDGGACNIGLESTIVGIENDALIIYRKGGLAAEEIEETAGQKVQINTHSSSNPASPGMLKSHYAPRKPLHILTEKMEASPTNKAKIGWLRFQSKLPNQTNQLVLSPSGNLLEAAQNLFAHLRTLDAMDVEEIRVELAPERGLGRAINDRLRRAAAQE